MLSNQDSIEDKNLKSFIFKTISNSKIHNVSSILRNSQRRVRDYLQCNSQHIFLNSEGDSPKLKTQLAKNKQYNSSSCSRRSQSHHKTEKNSKKKKKSQRINQHLSPVRRLFDNPKSKSQNMMLTTLQKMTSKKKTKKKDQQQKMKKSSLDLQSIEEHPSSEDHLVTPSSKYHSKSKKKTTRNSNQKTSKKRNKHSKIEQKLKKKISLSFKEPEKFQKIYNSQVLTVRYRILRGKLVQIELYAVQELEQLQVVLSKGNIQCQNINEQYSNIKPTTFLTLYSSVRSMDYNDLYNYPKLVLNFRVKMDFQKETICLSRTIFLPYTWLHFIDKTLYKSRSHKQLKSQSPQRSRMKTKIVLENIEFSKKSFRLMQSIFKNIKHSSQSQVEYRFAIENREFDIRVYGRQGYFKHDIQIEGKGEERLTNFLEYIIELLS